MRISTRLLASTLCLCVGYHAAADLVSATLPTSRSVEVGNAATAFASVINVGAQTATGCRIQLPAGVAAGFSYQTTDPANNLPVGTPNTPVAIAAGATQSFVFAITPNEAIAPLEVPLVFTCDNAGPTPVVEGLNTLLLSASTTPVSDVIAIAQTVIADGILNLAPNGEFGAFAVAAANVGASDVLTVRARTGFDFMGDILVCRTDPVTGACAADPAASVTTPIDNGETPTFSVFASTTDTVTPDPAGRRLFLEFVDGDEATRGSTSVAVAPRNPSGVPDTLGLISGGIGLVDFFSTVQITGVPVEIQVAVGGSGFAALGIGSNGLVAVGGSGFALGAVDDFGSVIVNDRRIETSDAAFSVEGAEAEQSDLQVGQHLLIVTDGSGDSAIAVLYRSMVKGPVTGVAAVDAEAGTAELTVFGQRVLIDATTVLDDTTLGAIAVGDLLEVSGVVADDGAIIASFVEDKPLLAEYKVVGAVAGLTGTTFGIGGLTVDYASAEIDNFPEDTVVEGAVVEVKGLPTDFTAPASFTASKVELLPFMRVDQNAAAQIEGFIDSFVSPTEFTVQSQRVTTDANTQFLQGTAASLGLGVKVEVFGSIDDDGVLNATSVRIKPTNAVRAEGALTATDPTAATLSLLGVTYAVTDQTRFDDGSAQNEEPLDLGDLMPGNYLEVRGFLDGATLIAAEVRREDGDERARLRGPVTTFDETAGTVTILDVGVSTEQGLTRFENAADELISRELFFDRVRAGAFVKATWDPFTATTEPATELSLED